MYEFTNGIVVFDEKTRDRYIEAGYKLVDKFQSFPKEASEKLEQYIEKQSVAEQENVLDYYEMKDENTSNDRIIKRQSKKCNKPSK